MIPIAISKTPNDMELTEEQIFAIIDDISSKLQEVIDNPMDESDLECEEDDYGRCYPCSSGSVDIELEEICYDGLPGLKDADTYITAKGKVDYSYYYDYDPGDYWTPPAGGWELRDSSGSINELEIEICALNPETGEYEDIKVDESVKKRIIESVNSKIGCEVVN